MRRWIETMTTTVTLALGLHYSTPGVLVSVTASQKIALSSSLLSSPFFFVMPSSLFLSLLFGISPVPVATAAAALGRHSSRQQQLQQELISAFAGARYSIRKNCGWTVHGCETRKAAVPCCCWISPSPTFHVRKRPRIIQPPFASRPFYSTKDMLFSSSSSFSLASNSGTSDSVPVSSSSSSSLSKSMITPSEKTNRQFFGTNYHAPVMYRECIQALLKQPLMDYSSCGGDDDNKNNVLLTCDDNSDTQIQLSNNNQQHQTKKTKKKKKWMAIEQEIGMDNIDRNNNSDEKAALRSDRGRIFVDGTLGGGGHAEALLQQLESNDIVIGCDVDLDALQVASQRLGKYIKHPNNANGTLCGGKDNDCQENQMIIQTDQMDNLPTFVPVQANFAQLHRVIPSIVQQYREIANSAFLDGILLDLGLSSYQIDTPERGFAFMQAGPLDMRMSSSSSEGIASSQLTAADICNEYDEASIVALLRRYGDEPRAKAIAASIVQHRPLYTTQDLVDAVAAVTPTFVKHSRRLGRTATLARVFQSIRIVVNQEDQALRVALTEMAPLLLRPGGRLVVLSYHSMEDRATKQMMRDGMVELGLTPSQQQMQKQLRSNRDVYGNAVGPDKPFRSIGKPVKGSEEEVTRNPRARSATLRVAERL